MFSENRAKGKSAMREMLRRVAWLRHCASTKGSRIPLCGSPTV